MPYTYRVTQLFSGFGVGWSETHVFTRQESDPGAVAGVLVQFAQLRANLLGREYKMDGYRVKLYLDATGARVRRAAFPQIQQFSPADQTAVNKGDPAFVAGRVIMSDITGQHITRVFMGGPPDGCTDSGGAFKASYQGWDQKVKDWFTEGVARGLSYLSFPVLRDVGISNYVIGPGLIVTYTHPAASFPAPDFGKTFVARVSGLNNQKSILNRVQNVAVIDAVTSATIKSHAAGPFASSGRMKTYNPLPSVFPLAGFQISPITARHKRGRPFGASPGRLRAQPLV